MVINIPSGGIIPLISVILPVYNGEKYLADAIESVLAQTFTEFELIVIDDGSTDSSNIILQRFQQEDRRIRLLTRVNSGLAAALNEGISHARGAFIARMDCDDISLPQRFERQLDWLKQTGADICGSWARYFGSADKRIVKHPQSDNAIKMALLFGAPFVHPSVIMKTVLAKKLLYNEEWNKAEDYDLWERAACAGYNMTNIPEVLLLYRIHQEQASSIASIQQQLLTQKIQERYWYFVSNSLGLNKNWIAEVLKIRTPLAPRPNMDSVDLAFKELLQHSYGEARETVFDHVTRLYYRIAATCPDVLERWSRLNNSYGTGYSWNVMIKLCLLRLFRIRADSPSFCWIKKIYFSLVR